MVMEDHVMTSSLVAFQDDICWTVKQFYGDRALHRIWDGMKSWNGIRKRTFDQNSQVGRLLSS
jgi:hypothetical protein